MPRRTGPTGRPDAGRPADTADPQPPMTVELLSLTFGTIAPTLQLNAFRSAREKLLTHLDVQVNNLTPHAGPVTGRHSAAGIHGATLASRTILRHPPGQPTPETENPKMSTTTPSRTPRGVPRRSFLARVATGATAALLAVGLAACGSSPAAERRVRLRRWRRGHR